MRTLVFLILVGYAVKCDDSSNNYYVIEMPEEDTHIRTPKKPFKVYWNVPTMQCKSKRIPFENLYEKYGIIQNKDDHFRGEKIAILYDPGLFPALLKNETSGKFKFRNGGVPQEGDIEIHMDAFRSVLNASIPDPNFSGIGIIDFESWRPVFRQNFGVLVPYKDVSYEMERKLHRWWPKAWVIAEAKERFEAAARAFMQTSISIAKQMRPHALWGYYGFPYCFNMANNNMKTSCADRIPQENDMIYWLWMESTALYPSLYSSRSLSPAQLAGAVAGRVREAGRVARGASVLPYFWFRYRDGDYFTQEDLDIAVDTLYKSEASGFIIWGSSNDVNTIDKCKELLEYVDNILGPTVAKYTKKYKRTDNDFNEIDKEKPVVNSVTNNYDIIPDPEFHWIPPENYTHDIVQYVEDEFNKKNITNKDGEVKGTNLSSRPSNILIDFLLGVLANKTEHTTVIDKSIVVEYVNITEDSELFNTTTESYSTTTEGIPYMYFETTFEVDNRTEKLVDSEEEKIVTTDNYDFNLYATVNYDYVITERPMYKENIITSTESNILETEKFKDLSHYENVPKITTSVTTRNEYTGAKIYRKVNAEEPLKIITKDAKKGKPLNKYNDNNNNEDMYKNLESLEVDKDRRGLLFVTGQITTETTTHSTVFDKKDFKIKKHIHNTDMFNSDTFSVFQDDDYETENPIFKEIKDYKKYALLKDESFGANQGFHGNKDYKKGILRHKLEKLKEITTPVTNVDVIETTTNIGDLEDEMQLDKFSVEVTTDSAEQVVTIF